MFVVQNFTILSFLFIVLTKWPSIFLLSSPKDPFFLNSLSPKDPYFGGRVCTSPSLPYVSAPPPPDLPEWFHFDTEDWARGMQWYASMVRYIFSYHFLCNINTDTHMAAKNGYKLLHIAITLIWGQVTYRLSWFPERYVLCCWL